jgi:hypothetical protein
MLVYTLNKIRGHSCIQGAIPSAAKKVNVELFQGLSLDSRLRRDFNAAYDFTLQVSLLILVP